MLSAQFAYGEPKSRRGWGNNPDAIVIHAVEVHVYTTSGTDPYKLGSTGATNDAFIIVDDRGRSFDPFVQELWVQQLGDNIGLVSQVGDRVNVFALRDAEIIYHQHNVPVLLTSNLIFPTVSLPDKIYFSLPF